MLRRASLLLVVALALAGCGAGAAGTPPATPQRPVVHVIAIDSKLLDRPGGAGAPNAGEMAPDFQYTLSDGTTHKLSDLRGKKVVINFWATWCEPCREEMPDLQKTLQDYGDAIAILGVNKLEQAEKIPPFADEFGITFPLIANPAGDISDRYGTQNIPTSFFVNTDGTIGFRKLGVMTYDFMKTHLDQLR